MKSARGFTLIELLVVISILAILGAFGFAALVNYDRQQTLKTAARDLQTHLRLAQNKAIVQEKPTACATNSPLTGYRLSFVSSINYQIQPLCPPSTPPITGQFSLPSDISRSGADGVTFKAGSGTVDTSVTITLTSALIGGSENIVVTQSGVIQ